MARLPLAQVTKRVPHVLQCTRRVPYLVVTSLLLAGFMPPGVRCQVAQRVDSVGGAVDVSPGRPYPDLGKRREITLSSVGAGLLAARYLVPVAGGAVPREGLDPIEIAWSLDRGIIGHQSLSADRASDWTADAAVALPLGLTEHLLRRPSASRIERAGIGFLGGALAGATSALRVQAGQHFPSDVIVGAGIGIVTGVAVPLLHRGKQRLPSSNAWLEMMAGLLAGTLFGVMMAQGY